MRDIDEMLEEFEEIIEELRELARQSVILVEGRKDRHALDVLGVHGDIVQVQDARGIFGVAEELAAKRRSAVILTDWDRKGGQLAELLRNALRSCGVPYDDSIRMKIAVLSKKEIKDVESIPAFVSLLDERRRTMR
ncbi:MAG TPA: Toprim subdomain protein [Methanomassiliicoccaceae archaeon]|nr:Toprim subdomain protein [Euryarchaeota archaeon]HOB37668.1 Toprim subdomain protein [Methanomassiliicoccaceae archaeon]HOL06769.1 Toprim subdomain protein [Methanomassiliicoccaceae archaeon]HOQ25236.1 Toprim subdomain protein [Methanomassiliicoccaceae archaeon]HPP45264.1 Toprim subdomain protein [Methanomassiliicoccaceae archaeon]